MAIQTAANISVGLDRTPLERDIAAIFKKKYQLDVSLSGGRNPLGQISKDTDKFSESLKAAESRVLAFGAVTGIMYGVTSAIKEMVAATLDVEQRLTDINVLLNLSGKELNTFGKELFNIAKNTAQTFATVSDVAKEFSRQGLGLNETLERTSAALVLVRQSGLDAEGAVSAITSAINSFTKEMNTAADITNKFAAVDQAFAVSSRDLAEAVSRVGSTAQDAGVSLNELLGIVTAVQQTTSRGGAVIGNALKTIFTRLGNKEAVSQLKELGVDINDTQNGLQKLQAISSAIALNPEYANEIKRVAGGVYQINIVSAALQDLQNQYGITAQAAEKAGNAGNAAFERNARQNETLATTVNAVQQNLVALGASLGNDLFGPAIKSIGGQFNELFDTLKNADEGSFTDIGTTVGSGIMKGIGDYIAGPGAFLLATVFGRIALKFVTYSKKAFSLDNLFADVRTPDKNEQNVGAATRVLQQQPDILRSVLNGTLSIQDASRTVLAIINQQNAVLEKQYSLMTKIATTVAVGSPIVPIGVGAKVTKPSPVRKASSGYIPDFAEQAEISGAIQAGYKPGKVKAKHIKGLGKIYYNDAEKIVNFDGMDQPAIMPPQNSKAGKNYKKEFEGKLGFDPYRAEGMVPNYNKFSYLNRGSYAKVYKVNESLVGKVFDPEEGIQRIFGKNKALQSFNETREGLQYARDLAVEKDLPVKIARTYKPEDFSPLDRHRKDADKFVQEFGQNVYFQDYIKSSGQFLDESKRAEASNLLNQAAKKKRGNSIVGFGDLIKNSGNFVDDTIVDLLAQKNTYSKGMVPKRMPNYANILGYHATNRKDFGSQIDPKKSFGEGQGQGFYAYKNKKDALNHLEFLKAQSFGTLSNQKIVAGKFNEEFVAPDYETHTKEALTFLKDNPDLVKTIKPVQLFDREGYPLETLKSVVPDNSEITFNREFKSQKRQSKLKIDSSEGDINSGQFLGPLFDQLRNDHPDKIRDFELGLLKSEKGKAFRYFGEKTKAYSSSKFSSGLVPNYKDLVEYSPAVKDAIAREQAAGLPLSQIRIGKDTRIKSKDNPQGIGIYNKIDEPLGIKQGVNRAISEKRDPKSYGTKKASGGLVPNFASESANFNFGNSGFIKDDLDSIKQAFKAGTASQKDLNAIISNLAKTYSLTENEVKKYTSNLAKSAKFFEQSKGPSSFRGSVKFSQEKEKPLIKDKSEGDLLNARELVGKKLGVKTRESKKELNTNPELKSFKDIADIESKKLAEADKVFDEYLKVGQKYNKERIKVAKQEASDTIKASNRGTFKIRPTPQILESFPQVSKKNEEVSFGPQGRSIKGSFKVRPEIQFLDSVKDNPSKSEGTLLSSREKTGEKLFQKDLAQVSPTLLKLAQKTQRESVSKSLNESDAKIKDVINSAYQEAIKKTSTTADRVFSSTIKKSQESKILFDNQNPKKFKDTYTKYDESFPNTPFDEPLPAVSRIRNGTTVDLRSAVAQQNKITAAQTAQRQSSSFSENENLFKSPFGNFKGELGSASKDFYKSALDSVSTKSKFTRAANSLGEGKLGLGLGLGVPILSGIAQEAIGGETLGRRRASSAVGGVSNIVSSAATGALIGGAFGGIGAPIGAVAGAAIGGIGSINSFLKEFNNTLPDLEKNLRAIENTSSQTSSSLSAYINATQQLEAVYSGAASARPEQIKRLNETLGKSLRSSNLSPEQIDKIKNSRDLTTVIEIGAESAKQSGERRDIEAARINFASLKQDPTGIKSYGKETNEDIVQGISTSFDAVLSTVTKTGETFDDFFTKNFQTKFNDPATKSQFDVLKTALKEAGIDKKFPEVGQLNEGFSGIKDSRLQVFNSAFRDQLQRRKDSKEAPQALQKNIIEEVKTNDKRRNALEEIQKRFARDFNTFSIDNETQLKKSEGEDQIFKAQKDIELSTESAFLSEGALSAKRFNNALIELNLSFDQLSKKNVADAVLRAKDSINSLASDLIDRSNNIASDSNLTSGQRENLLGRATTTANKSKEIFDSIQSPQDIDVAIETYRGNLRKVQEELSQGDVGKGQEKFLKSEEKSFQEIIEKLLQFKTASDKVDASLQSQLSTQGKILRLQEQSSKSLIDQAKERASFGGLGAAPRISSASGELFNLKEDLKIGRQTGDLNAQTEALNRIANIYRDLGLELPGKIRQELESVELKSIESQISKGIRTPISEEESRQLAQDRINSAFPVGRGVTPGKELDAKPTLNFSVSNQLRSRPEAFTNTEAQNDAITKLQETQTRLNEEIEAGTMDIFKAQNIYNAELEKTLSIQGQFEDYVVVLRNSSNELREQSDLFDNILDRENFIKKSNEDRLRLQRLVNLGVVDGVKAQKDQLANQTKLNALKAEEAFLAGRIGSESLKSYNAAKRAAELNSTGKLKASSIGEAFGDQFKNNNIDNFKALNDAAVDFGQEFKSGIKGAFAEFQDGTKSAKEALIDLGLSLGKSLGQKAFNIGIDNILGATLGQLKFAKGGEVKRFSKGGEVTGGSGVRDDVPALLTDGEYVINKEATKRYGIDFLESVNDKRIDYKGEPTSVSSGAQSFNGVFSNTLRLDDPKNPTKGTLVTDDALSTLALEDDNNPQNIARLRREDLLGQYIRGNKKLMDDYKKKKNNALNAALIQAGISLVGVGVGAASGAYGSKVGNVGSSVAGAAGNTLSSSPYQTGLSYNQSGIGGGTTFNPSVPASQSGYGSYTNFNYSQVGVGNNDFDKIRFRAKGGPIKKYARGGDVFGGDSYSDRIPALLTDGEFVITKDASRKYGKDFLEKLNDQKITKLADGGAVSTQYAGSSSPSIPFEELVDSLTSLKKTMEELIEKSDSKASDAPKAQSGTSSTPQFNIVINNTITQDKSGRVTGSSSNSSSSKSGDSESDDSKNSRDESQKNAERAKALGERMASIARRTIAEETRPGGILENINQS